MVSWSALVDVLLGGSCMIFYSRLWDSSWWVAVFRVSRRSSVGFPSRMSLVPTMMYTGLLRCFLLSVYATTSSIL